MAIQILTETFGKDIADLINKNYIMITEEEVKNNFNKVINILKIFYSHDYCLKCGSKYEVYHDNLTSLRYFNYLDGNHYLECCYNCHLRPFRIREIWGWK